TRLEINADLDNLTSGDVQIAARQVCAVNACLPAFCRRRRITGLGGRLHFLSLRQASECGECNGQGDAEHASGFTGVDTRHWISPVAHGKATNGLPRMR